MFVYVLLSLYATVVFNNLLTGSNLCNLTKAPIITESFRNWPDITMSFASEEIIKLQYS